MGPLNSSRSRTALRASLDHHAGFRTAPREDGAEATSSLRKGMQLAYLCRELSFSDCETPCTYGSTDIMSLLPSSLRGGLGPLPTSSHPLRLGDVREVVSHAVSHVTGLRTLALTPHSSGDWKLCPRKSRLAFAPCSPRACRLSQRAEAVSEGREAR